jgi:septum formation protein
MQKLVLASSSIYRRELLGRLGVAFESCAPECDEEAMKQPALAPRDYALHLARAKAESLRARFPDAYLLGSDQVVELDGKLLGKPHTSERATAQLRAMSGRAHRLVTAFSLLAPDDSCDEHVAVHTLHMRPLTAEAIARYVAADAPLDCAGSYKIEARGITLFSRIEGEDFSAITGLPLIALVTCLQARGFVVP